LENEIYVVGKDFVAVDEDLISYEETERVFLET